MGKKKQSGSLLGRSLIRDRFGSRHRNGSNSMLHTSELNDGYEWGRLNLQSVTEESSFKEFLSTAELAGTEFQAEKLNIKFVNPAQGVGLLNGDEKIKVERKHSELKGTLKIPRRPKWDSNMTAEELQGKERADFLEWRRKLAALQESEGLLLTPYEKNLDFWRQLWRVVEKSDIIAQILDARNPLMFRCEDLERYVKEVDSNKLNLLILNKADFLTRQQRRAWAKHFDSCQITVVFFSAVLAAEGTIPEEPSDEELLELDDESAVPDEDNDSEYATDEEEEIIGDEESTVYQGRNSSKLMGQEELISMLKKLLPESRRTQMNSVTTVGLVGYPNVGKSSTINSILQNKKVSVSATPGKTKHFQTLFIDQELMLCDCPGLVMPSFVSTKADMVVHGILPVDQMKDHVPPVNLLTSLIPRHVLQSHYSIMIPKPLEGEDPDRPPTAEEFLNAYGYSRGFMTQNGQPDNPRAARYVLKDLLCGKLLYCHAPPGVPQECYHTWTVSKRNIAAPTPAMDRAVRVSKVSGEDLDRAFFSKVSLGAHTKGAVKVGQGSQVPSTAGSTLSLTTISEEYKPWKNHKEKRNKKEKLRRVYRHLDRH